MVMININDEICPSCGHPKQDSTKKDMSGKPVCFYCYHRGMHGTVKMLLLCVLHELNERYITADELVERMNIHPINNGRRTFNYYSVYGRLQLITRKNNKLVLRSKKKNPKTKRNLITYRISKKGEKYLKRYLEEWNKGFFVELKPSEYRKKLRSKLENSFKHFSILKKIEDGEYERFSFIFPDGLKDPVFKNKFRKVHVGKKNRMFKIRR